MKSQNYTFIISAFAIVVAISAITFFVKNKELRTELKASAEKGEQLERTMEYYEQMAQVDSLLVEGNYEDALNTSKEQLQQINDGHESVELRIALANKMLKMDDGLRRMSEADSLRDQVDSTSVNSMASTIAKIDSLQFALEKSKVRLHRLKRQLRDNSGGAYLTFTNSKGSQIHYVGEIKDGKANGNGIALLNTGSRYKGQWKDNKRHGEGTFHWPDGDYYVGDYENDKRSGQGTYFWHNGEKFVGLWKNDERTGEGVFYGKEGEVVAQGHWEGDELVEAVKL